MKRTGFKNKQRKPLARISKNPANVALRKKKKKAVTLTKLNDKLWELTRQICFRTYGTDCYTCPKKNLIGRNLHGGHVPWPKSALSKMCAYDIRYIRAQCYDCNINKGGMGAVALDRMIHEIGIEAVETLRVLSEKTKGGMYGRQWTLEKIQECEIQFHGD